RMLPCLSRRIRRAPPRCSHNRFTVCQNTLFADRKSASISSLNFSQALAFALATILDAALRASSYLLRVSGVLFAIHSLKSTFFSPTAFWTSWFHQGVRLFPP